MLLFLNDIAGSEILVILIFILMFFGAKSIPGIARTMGRTIRQIKDASGELQSEIRKSGADLKKDLNLEGLIRETEEEIRVPLDQYTSDLENAVKFEPSRNTQIPKIPEPTQIPADQQTQAKIEEEPSKKDDSEPAMD